MTENELNQRRAGFIAALNLLAASAEPAALEAINSVLGSHGADLYKEIEAPQSPDSVDLSSANPCPPGYYWDPVISACVPIIID